jgi:hypothetical protein
MPAGGKLAAQGYGGEGVAGVPECRQQDAPARALAQSISAMSRTICLRSSASKATGVTVRVPTPASL